MSQQQEVRGIRASDIVTDDERLSLAAKGLFALIGFMGNGCTLQDVENRTTDPPEFVQMVLDELLRVGYIDVTDRIVRIRRPEEFFRRG